MNCPKVSATLELGDGLTLTGHQPTHQALPHLSGWGVSSLGVGGLMPSLSTHGHRTSVTWQVRGSGTLKINWTGGRGGKGTLLVTLGEDS